MRRIKDYGDYLFYSIYSSIKAIEGGYSSQTNSWRMMFASNIISLLFLLNLVAFLQINFSLEVTIAMWLVLCAFSYLIFGYRKRYLTIAKRFAQDRNRPRYAGVFSILFVIVTIVHFVMRNPLTKS